MSRHAAGRDPQGPPMDPDRLGQELRAQARAAAPPTADRLSGVRRKRAQIRRTRGAVGIVAAVVATGILVGAPRLMDIGTTPATPAPAAPSRSDAVPTPTDCAPGRWERLPPMVMLHGGRYYHQAEGARLSARYPGGTNRSLELHAQPKYRLAMVGTLTAPPEAEVRVLLDGKVLRTLHGSGLVLVDLRRHPGWRTLGLQVDGPLTNRESLAIRSYRDLPNPTPDELGMAICR